MHAPTSEAADSGRVELAVSGMTCSGCAATVQRVLARVPGVQQVEVDLAAGRAQVLGTAPLAALLAAVQAAGFGAASAG